MRLVSLDHIVLTVNDLRVASAFYRDVLGMEETVYGAGRHAFHFGMQKINLQERDKKSVPSATTATPGSSDLCFLVDDLEEAIERLTAASIEIVEGPVYRSGANSSLLSIYIRDPDGNLLELSQPKNVVLAPDEHIKQPGEGS